MPDASALPATIGPLKSVPVIQRHPNNPILSAKDIPYDATLIFNAGVVKFQGRYVMAFRNDFFPTPSKPYSDKSRVSIGLAYSRDGVRWEAQSKPWLEIHTDEMPLAYDPRLTVIEGRCYICFVVHTRHGLRAAIAVTDDFDRFELLHLTTPDNRNMVLFPEKIGGRYVRLERPFPVYSRGGRDRFDTWLSRSPDLRYWGDSDLLLAVEDLPFANDKIGPGAPPVKTHAGWLTSFHSVDIDPSRGKNGWETAWKKRYCAGIMLLDLKEPNRIIGLCREPLIAPEAPYETSGGFRNNVIFPGGMILEDSGEVKIYYGAADTVECLVTADVDDLIRLCSKENLPDHRVDIRKLRLK
jgi:beta-1,4-mannooligosaccharide/beta-1,4-mannosyl-N-acetylglucosamine phosphorylase